MKDKLLWFFAFFTSLIFILSVVSCQKETVANDPVPVDNTTTPPKEDTFNITNELLKSFVDENGGQNAFPSNQLLAIETFLSAQEDVEAGNLDQAKVKIDEVFNQMPYADQKWQNISANTHCADCSFNFGHPTAYYGLRMLDQIISLGNPESSESLTMTVVIAPCAEVKRPTLPNLTPETVNLTIYPKITENDGQLLHKSTALFRRWVQAITGGVKVNLKVHTLDGCTSVNYTDDGKTIVSYPSSNAMINAVPSDIAEDTDFWWVIAPSGVPGDGSGYNRHFISGGMASFGAGLPVFLSDDAWFIRKPEHMGKGDYHELETIIYQPQWFQHEFMHHLYRKWPEFGLEDESHQWFDRSTWPSDFVGSWEPDYYIESLNKRLLNATPSLSEGLKAPRQIKITDPSLLVGKYERQPIENQWHEVEIVLNDDELRWRNNAGFSWLLGIIDGKIWTGPDCPYGVHQVTVEVDSDQKITSLFFREEAYKKTN